MLRLRDHWKPQAKPIEGLDDQIRSGCVRHPGSRIVISRLVERLRDYRRNQIRYIAANNKHESIDKFQWGGTAIVAHDMLANMTRATGIDDTGLGRWSWIQLERYNNRRVRIISAYNPCRTRTHQFATVCSQQKRYFLSKGKDICPRLQFRKDLVSTLHAWTQKDESVILLIDCNENLSRQRNYPLDQ